jgi:probable HAF family extracellular repeat protein
MGTRGFSKAIGILVVAVGLAATTGPLAAQRSLTPRYSVTDLGTLGGPSSEAAGVNNLGEVVGSSATAAGVSHAFFYRNGRIVDLGTLPGGTSSYGTAINDRGDVVGYSGINGYGPQFQEFVQGFVWQDDRMRAVGALYCPCSYNVRYGTSRAFAISVSGRIVGDSETIRGQAFRHAFVWQENVMTDLGLALNALQPSYAFGINDINEVAGTVSDHAFLVTNGQSVDLGVLPGFATSAARAVNNKGQVAGTSAAAGGISHAFVWDRGTLRDLGTLPGDVASEARAINVNGDVVGRSGGAGFSTSRAVLWQEGLMVDLNSLISASGWTLSSATGTNDVRQIVGVGLHNGQVRAFLLSPQ